MGYRSLCDARRRPGQAHARGKPRMHEIASLPSFGYFTAALLATAAVALSSGMQFLVIGLRHQRELMYQAYAVLCICIAALALSNVLLDCAATLAQATLALRLMYASSIFSFPAFIVFVSTYTRKPVGRIVFGVILVVATGLFWFDLRAPYGLHAGLSAGAPMVLPWGESLFTLEVQPSIGSHVFHALTYLVFLWALRRSWKFYRDGQARPGLLLGICLLVQFFAMLWGDIAVDIFDQPYPYLDAFAFLPFVLLMGVSLASQLRARTLQLEQTTLELRAEAETRREAELDLRHIAYHDPLTGLPNRSRALHSLAEMLADATQSGRHGAVLMIDLDNFKTINDSLGHHVGDRVLEAIADCLLAAAPGESTVARLGGDEFLVLLDAGSHDAMDADATAALAMGVAESMVKRLSVPLPIDSRILAIGASIGVAVFPNGDAEAADIVRCADIALYRAKAAGRNGARLFLPHMQRDADNRLELERGLRTALERDQLSLHFQPQVSMNGKLLGAEALLRWRHPELGDVPPDVFIPVAEETGLIHALGTWVITRACAHIQAWRSKGVNFGGCLAVNVSPWQIAHPQFVEHIQAIVVTAGIDPQWLTLELTESALLNDFEAALATLHALSNIGFRLAMDDFGTGYSSLAYLQQLPLDELKIDRSFVSALQPSVPDPLAGFIVDIGRRLGMATIAEGVETEQQRARLGAMGCDTLQGYLICRPLPEAEFLHWLATRQTVAGKSTVA
jgi:diguanylate cyclase (GGDEF)-like protein